MLRTSTLFMCFVLTALGCRAEKPAANAVYQAGDSGYACFRIPALLRAADGSLLAFAEARRDGTSDKGDIDLVVRRSQDNGRTWGALSVVWDDGDNTCGNPAPVVEQQTGRIVLLTTWNLGSDHEKEIERGTATDTRRAFKLYSDDHGATWSTPEQITSSVKQPGWTWYATGPCHAIQKRKNPHKGRLIVSSNHKWMDDQGSVCSNSHLLYSDDRGSSWHIGAISQTGGNESTVVELSNGDLMLNMRRYNKRDSVRQCAVSRDGGQTWSHQWEESQLLEPRCQGSILNYALSESKPSSTLLFSNPRSRKRENMTIGVSHDNGRTWSHFETINKGRAAYSDLVRLPDGSVGILYENGEGAGKDDIHKRITFEVIASERLFK